jgi:CheY-like chemotaxis protein
VAQTVLVIDDSLTVRKVAERELCRAGYAVRTAASGGEGIRLAFESTPDVLLVDYLLPDMSGPDVCRVLATDARTQATPIIVLSGHKLQKLCTDFGGLASVKACVEKPFAPDKLVSEIQATLVKREPPPACGETAPEPASPPPQRSASVVVPAIAAAATPDRTAENIRITKIVDDILAVLDKPADLRKMLLRIIVRKQLLSK